MDQPVPLLLVEDEPDLREALGEYLDACGFAVTAVGTAREALTAAEGHEPRILITDLSLPDRRGDQFLEEFHGAHPGVLLYVHSGDANFTPSRGLQACGVSEDHVFSKPTDLAVLVTALHHELAIHPNLSEE